MIGEPGETETSVAPRARRSWLGYRVLQFRQARSVDVDGTKPTQRNLFPKQVDGVLIVPDRTGGVTEPLEFGRKRLPVRDEPAGGAWCRGLSSRGCL